MNHCRICQHEHLTEIEQAVEAGMPYAEICQKFGVSKAGIHRHRHHADITPPTQIDEYKELCYLYRKTRREIRASEKQGKATAFLVRNATVLLKRLSALRPAAILDVRHTPEYQDLLNEIGAIIRELPEEYRQDAIERLEQHQ